MTIGIFLSKDKWHGLISRHYNSGLAALVQAADSLNITPIWFSLPQEFISQGMLSAAANKEGILQLGLQAFPEVVYDLSVFAEAERPQAQQVRDALKERHVKFVNSHPSFSKWTTHLVLSKYALSSYLPHTILFSYDDDLAEMLTTYRQICVKSVGGSRGKEVLFIHKRRKEYTLLFPNGSCRQFPRIKDLSQAIQSFMGPKQSLIQQSIDLATWQNRRFDFRVLMQKVSLHQWDCTALCLRLALSGHGVTSTSQGSEVKTALPLLRKLWPANYYDILTEIKQLSYLTADALEHEYGSLGELGIDIGVDVNGKVWLFEVNGKPGKVTVRKLKQVKLTQLAYQRPLLYATMLLEDT